MKLCVILAWFMFLALVYVVIGLLLGGCVPTMPLHYHYITVARVTYYCQYEDRFGSRTACGGRAREGLTLAAPKVIPFGTPVVIPGLGSFTCQDRGRALEKAYRHGQLRLDIYVASRARLRRLQFGMPEYMEAEIE